MTMVYGNMTSIVDQLANGSLHLTAVSLLGPHLTTANHVDVLNAAKHQSKREVEQLIARLRPQPDVPAVVRKLPAPNPAVIPSVPLAIDIPEAQESTPPPQRVAASTLRSEIKPLAPERFKVQFTVSRETHEKLRRVQDLLRHTIPNGDPAAIFDRALSLLLVDLSKTKFAASSRPRRVREGKPGSRHIPAAIKREVWRRDSGQCAFRGDRGRCLETGFLEFHHVVPFAKGGALTRENLELRCRSHNAYEAEQEFARLGHPLFARETRADYQSNRELGPDRVPAFHLTF
jgi:hypothetical protein